MTGRFRQNLLWLAAYGAMVLAVVVAMRAAKAKFVPLLSSPEAQANWDAWREEAAKTGGPVKRRPVKSPEPNLLVLLRDYFATFTAFILFFLSLIFLVTMIFIRGAMKRSDELGVMSDEREGREED